MKWISILDKHPRIGQICIVCFNGVVQDDTYEFDQGDCNDFGGVESFWDREELDEGRSIKDNDFWMPLPVAPKVT